MKSLPDWNREDDESFEEYIYRVWHLEYGSGSITQDKVDTIMAIVKERLDWE